MSRTPAKDRKTFIYFLRSGEFVKIGQSRRWKVRAAQMQIGSPYTVATLLVLVGPSAMERALHSRFRASHFRGEWFHLTDAITTFIKENLKDCAAKAGTSELPPEQSEEIIL